MSIWVILTQKRERKTTSNKKTEIKVIFLAQTLIDT